MLKSKMNDSKLTCHYHPNRDQNTKCEFCGKLICNECKMIYKEHHYSHGDFSGFGPGSYGSIYSIPHTLCIPCYYDRRIKRIKSPLKYLIILFGIILTIVALSVNIVLYRLYPFSIDANSISLIFICIGIGLVIFGIIIIKIIPMQTAFINAKKQQFFYKLSKYDKTRNLVDSNSAEIRNCPYCGEKIN